MSAVGVWALATLAGVAFVGLPFLAALDRSRGR